MYAIKDQLDIDPNIVKSGEYTEKVQKLKEVFQKFEQKYEVSFVTDILLNHTSYDS